MKYIVSQKFVDAWLRALALHTPHLDVSNLSHTYG